MSEWSVKKGWPWQLPPSVLSWEACWAKGPTTQSILKCGQMGARRGQVVKAPTAVRATSPLPPAASEDRWGPGRSEAVPAENPPTVRDQTVIPNVIFTDGTEVVPGERLKPR